MVNKPRFDDIFILTCGGLGLMPFAPGTWGSLGSIIVGGVAVWCGLYFQVLGTVTMVMVLTTVALFWLGIAASDRYIAKVGEDDPGLIVIDEWVGQWIALLIFLGGVGISGNVHGSFLPGSMRANHGLEPILVGSLLLFGLFLFFRWFDIVKPGWAGWADRQLEGGYGVMMDDVFAGLFAGFAALGVTWLISLIL